jgi:FixJ family two-component response regulator
MTDGPLVAVIDDDESVRESLPDLLREFDFSPEVFSSAEAFLLSGRVSAMKCLVLDVAMPGMSGPELQKELKRARHSVPIIFMTAHSSEATRLNLVKRGAIACLLKPFSPTELLDALNAALRQA